MKTTFLLLLALTFSQAHSQPSYEVFAIRYGTVTPPFAISNLVQDGPKDQNLDAIFMVWLIRGNGKNILVDAGFLKDVEEAKDFKVQRYLRPDSAVMKAGVMPGEVTDIILTHPHWDHLDGIDLFPNANIWIQKEDYNYFVGAAWQKGGEHGGFNKRDVIKLVNINMSGKVNLVDGDDKEILAGIRVYTGSRHTFNSQYVLINTGSEKVIIASDNAYCYYNLEHLLPASRGSTFDPQGYVDAMKRMKSLASDAKYVIPGHDGLVFTKFPGKSEWVTKIR